MKHTRLLLSSFGGLVLALALLVALDPPHLKEALAAPAATVRYVKGDTGTDTGDCTSSQAPCKTIQYTLAHAGSEDIIRVAKGLLPVTYAGTVSIDKSVILEGGWGAVGSGGGLIWQRSSPCDVSWTTIDGGGAGRAISITGNITPTIDCFTITGGDAEGLGGDPDGNHAGGGIFSQDAAPIITNNVITGNYGCDTCSAYGRGGGIYLLNAPATAAISNNLIAGNVADESTWGQGGGIMLRDSNAQVQSNTIEYNRAGHSAGYGGGITVIDGEPTVADNSILHNVAGQGVQGLGGGIFVWSATPVTIERNLIESNQAIGGSGDANLTSRGGGIYYAGNPTAVAVIRDNTIRYNVSSPFAPQHGEGGGMYLNGLVTPSLVSGNTLEGNVGGYNHDGDGGGIYVNLSQVTIQDNHVFENAATWAGQHGEGGGLYVNGGTVLIQSNVITDNDAAYFPGFPSTATGYGGGVVISGSVATVQGNWIVGNGGTNGDNFGLGGGIYSYAGSLRIEGNTIGENYTELGSYGGRGGGVYITRSLGIVLGDNTIHDNTADFGGGGAYLELSDDAELTGNHIYSNTALWGGGLRLDSSDDVTLARNTFYRNMASYGGAMYLYGEGGPTWGLTLANNVVAENRASIAGPGVPGVYVKGVEAHLLHTTIARNTGGDGTGVYVTSGSVALTNTILVSHTVGIYVSGDSTATLEATLWGDGAWANGTNKAGSGTIDDGEIIVIGDPGFVDPDNGDYHIGLGSDAIDAGLDIGVTTDIDGDERPIGSDVDIGADEAWKTLFLPLVMRDS